jgi:hypothetical protein
MSVEPTSTNDPPQRLSLAARMIERRILTIAAIVLMHVVLLAVSALASAILNASVFLPKEPLLVTTVALLLAHCSLCAIWWARTSWSPHVKTADLLFLMGGLWILLVSALDSTRSSPMLAASWVTCLMIQIVLTAFGVVGVELGVNFGPAASRSRFSLFFLMLWTTIASAALALAGTLAGRYGFKLSDVTQSAFFGQLQAVGLANAMLALVAYAGVRLSRTRGALAISCAATILGSAIVFPLAMRAAFATDAGPTTADLVWLFGAEAAFLMLTLIPLVASHGAVSSSPPATNPPRQPQTARPQ